MRLVAILCLLLLAACAKEPPTYQEQGYVFGTLVDVSIYGVDETRARQAAGAVLQEFQRLHNMLHAWQPSELSELNAAIAKGESKTVSPELAAILQDATQISEQSGGTFNPAIGGLIGLWGFQADDFKPEQPDEKLIAQRVAGNPQMSDLVFSNANPSPALPLSGEGASTSPPPLTAEGSLRSSGAPTGVLLAGARGGREGLAFKVSSRNPAVHLDLGGYAKGYALDRAAGLLRGQGIDNALINIGGNIIALGRHGKRAWRIGIQHPRKSGVLATLDLRDGEAIGTSGDYQRYFELGGKRYSHLIDPRTGYPMQGVQAVTILTRGARAGILSDAASKPLFLAGADGWRAAATRMNLTEAMLVDAQGGIHLTAALQKRLEFADKNVRLDVGM